MSNRNSTDNSRQKSAPHHRISVKDVIRDYQAGLLTPAGAIFYLVAASRKIGESFRFSRSWVCRTLGIKQATFYRAIAALEEQCRLQFYTPDEVVAKVPISTTEGTPDYIFLEECSQICEKDYQICENFSHFCEKDYQICENQGLEPRTQAESGSPQLELSDQSKQLTTEDRVSPPTRPVEEKLKESGIELTEGQLNQIESFTEEQVNQAIEVVRGSKRVEDKVKFFFKALRNGWRPNLPPRESRRNFTEWFNRSRSAGLVVASMQGGDGIIRILMPDDRWLDLDEAILEVSGS